METEQASGLNSQPTTWVLGAFFCLTAAGIIYDLWTKKPVHRIETGLLDFLLVLASDFLKLVALLVIAHLVKMLSSHLEGEDWVIAKGTLDLHFGLFLETFDIASILITLHFALRKLVDVLREG